MEINLTGAGISWISASVALLSTWSLVPARSDLETASKYVGCFFPLAGRPGWWTGGHGRDHDLY